MKFYLIEEYILYVTWQLQAQFRATFEGTVWLTQQESLHV